MGAALTAAGATLMARRPDGSAPEKPHEGEEEGEQNGLPAAPDWNGHGAVHARRLRLHQGWG